MIFLRNCSGLRNTNIRSSTDASDGGILDKQGWRISSYNPQLAGYHYLDDKNHSFLLSESLECYKEIWESLSG